MTDYIEVVCPPKDGHPSLYQPTTSAAAGDQTQRPWSGKSDAELLLVFLLTVEEKAMGHLCGDIFSQSLTVNDRMVNWMMVKFSRHQSTADDLVCTLITSMRVQTAPAH